MPQPRPNDRLRLELVHQDELVVVANKAPGMVTEPGTSHRDDSLLNALAARFGGRLLRLGERRDYGLLHRLDRQTSGCVACALDPDAYDAIRGQFEARSVEKRYLAVVRGRMRAGTQTVALGLEERRAPAPEGTRLVSVVSRAGKPAVTELTVLATSSTHTLVSCEPRTGRLHQIRVHLAHLGFPIAGDPVYGLGARLLEPTAGRELPLGLHAWRLGFSHSAGRVDAAAPPSRKFLEVADEAGLRHDSLLASR